MPSVIDFSSCQNLPPNRAVYSGTCQTSLSMIIGTLLTVCPRRLACGRSFPHRTLELDAALYCHLGHSLCF